eukprot:2827651-Rhodomonas_salina.2
MSYAATRRVKRFAMCPDGEGRVDSAIALRVRCAVSGTDTAIIVHACYALSGTDLAYGDGTRFVWSGGLGGALAEVVERPAY